MLKLFEPAPVRTRLWQAGGAVALVVLCGVVTNVFVAPERAVHVTMLGHDFLAFYTAGTFVRQGRAAELYDLKAVAANERLVAAREGLDLHDAFGPWWNPPFYALPFAPLSMLPYRAAWATWVSING